MRIDSEVMAALVAAIAGLTGALSGTAIAGYYAYKGIKFSAHTDHRKFELDRKLAELDGRYRPIFQLLADLQAFCWPGLELKNTEEKFKLLKNTDVWLSIFTCLNNEIAGQCMDLLGLVIRLSEANDDDKEVVDQEVAARHELHVKTMKAVWRIVELYKQEREELYNQYRV
jgi:hypothetical protein